jgi:uncharacterized protein YheU (UPF0270 family)
MRPTRAALVVALLFCAACKKKADPAKEVPKPLQVFDAASAAQQGAAVIESETMVLRQVLVQVSDPAKAYSIDTRKLAKRLGASLLASRWLVARESEVPEGSRPRRVEAMINLSYDVTPREGTSEGEIVVALEVTLEFIDDRDALQPRVALIVQDTLLGSSEEEIAVELDALAQAGLDSVAESLILRERLRRASHEELLSQLSVGSDDPGLKIWGLQLAEDRSLREAVPAGIEALSHDDEHVRAAAIAMLVSLKDPRAITALSKDIDFKDHEDLRMVIEAVSAIGGEDAIEFLEFVASGHPEDDIRARAKESVQELRRRAAGQGESPNANP